MPSSSEKPAAGATHELAAIMFSDVVGYTALIGRDEQNGIQAIADHRENLRAVLPKFNGRLIGEIGDGTLSSFHSAIDAVNCAREVQALAVDNPELRLRIGIHLGDVVFTDNTVLGDGVNVASRIHALAPPGGICVSEHVYDEIRNKPRMQAKDLGWKQLKNVSRPIRVYALSTTAGDGGAFAALPSRTPRRWIRNGVAGAVVTILVSAIAYEVTTFRLHPAPAFQQPSIATPIRSLAVLPLENLSGDPSQEYFSDGMTEELITDLAKIGSARGACRHLAKAHG